MEAEISPSHAEPMERERPRLTACFEKVIKAALFSFTSNTKGTALAVPSN
jgi:hypothetical protein